ncbi:hypothetical protein NON00_16460 [Roseomonas sp. GC11]|uniref:hypothetical protein n=1 Tax=Roseomonas sp. GC11 TaxID=2950546 RepID=UPI00210E19F1|nr:hypothetical protein [Roseomonas sp. GC11]MCQ4161513.1 hypothetical protein [Roseomonas sp. GC11]
MGGPFLARLAGAALLAGLLALAALLMLGHASARLAVSPGRLRWPGWLPHPRRLAVATRRASALLAAGARADLGWQAMRQAARPLATSLPGGKDGKRSGAPMAGYHREPARCSWRVAVWVLRWGLTLGGFRMLSLFKAMHPSLGVP